VGRTHHHSHVGDPSVSEIPDEFLVLRESTEFRFAITFEARTLSTLLVLPLVRTIKRMHHESEVPEETRRAETIRRRSGWDCEIHRPALPGGGVWVEVCECGLPGR
jgi:hypothetical protein